MHVLRPGLGGSGLSYNHMAPCRLADLWTTFEITHHADRERVGEDGSSRVCFTISSDREPQERICRKAAQDKYWPLTRDVTPWIPSQRALRKLNIETERCN